MEQPPELILACQIIDLIRASGLDRTEAHLALDLAGTLLSAQRDLALDRRSSVPSIAKAASDLELDA